MDNSEQTIVDDSLVLTLRFCGDSGDGMQLVGQQFTLTAVNQGYDVKTRPDFPAEIRAPAGTQAGVSGFDISFADIPLYTTADEADVLVAMNPAALSVGLEGLKDDGLIIINQDEFAKKDWNKAKLDESLLSQLPHQVIPLPLTTLSQQTLTDFDLSNSQSKRSKNFVVLGVVCWLFDLSLDYVSALIAAKFGADSLMAKANTAAVKAGYNLAMTMELSRQITTIDSGQSAMANTRQITGIEAIAMACATLCHNTQTEMLISGYPITPASAILHHAANLSDFGIQLFQAEDEIAAICAAIGAAYGGKLALTATSGPGLDLKAEGMSLAVMAELPLVIIDVQRAGPSTGLPTKTEQSDLLMALHGRHGESPLPVLAASSPSDCFSRLIQAFEIAVKAMTPVVLLLDAAIANSAELWQLPNPEQYDNFTINYNQAEEPYQRLENLSRPWIIPGSENLMHVIGGLEKQGNRGSVSYDAANHQSMIKLRQQKIALCANMLASVVIEGKEQADNLIICWGSTYGSVKTAVNQLNKQGSVIALVNLTCLNPLPRDLANILSSYKRIFVAELNQGQLLQVIRSTYLVDAKGINQCNGKPFSVAALVNRIQQEISHEAIN